MDNRINDRMKYDITVAVLLDSGSFNVSQSTARTTARFPFLKEVNTCGQRQVTYLTTDLTARGNLQEVSFCSPTASNATVKNDADRIRVYDKCTEHL